MSTKHTPGPWLVAGGLTVYAVNAHSYNRFSAWVQRGHDDQRFPTSAQELEANARLISAAPELLEALKDCRRALELANATGEIAVVDAAIAKATGEQA